MRSTHGHVIALLLLAGCSDAPPSWDKLLAGRIAAQYPAYSVMTSPGSVSVARPGLSTITIPVAPIAAFCQRGPRDCEYAIDQMLLGLAPDRK